jgi:hypothetical protein
MTDYAIPIQVNGYSCRNCTDVGYAKKNVDPQHPQDGPFGVNAAGRASSPGFSDQAVVFGGALAGSAPATRTDAASRRLDITA